MSDANQSTPSPVKSSQASAVKSPAKATRPAAKRPKSKPLPPYNVILLDDDDHTHEYVMEMLNSIFGYDAPKGFVMAEEVDRRGRAIVFTTHKELAELKRDQIHCFGGDWRVATCQGAMSAVIEKADG
ncbi:MAG TPA: ATP-dependent Clp protease adaptor ClpS [Tepidisphaeraceae bacterium]|jgi:ATP-dependent Clp protease adaptor protein ClpS